MIFQKYIQLLFMVILLNSIIWAQQNNTKDAKTNPCNQPKQTTLRLIEEADENIYRFVRIEFWGSIYIRDRELRKQIMFSEGDIFTRKSFYNGIENLGNLRQVESVSLKNVKVILDPKNKDVSVIFCIKERGK